MSAYDDANEYVDAMERLSFIDFSAIFVGKQSRERCGVIDASGELVEWPNQHPEPRYNFTLPIAWLRTALDDPTVGVWAIWHTHPRFADRLPTPTDLQSIPEGLLGVVMHVGTKVLTLYVRGHVVGTMKYLR